MSFRRVRQRFLLSDTEKSARGQVEEDSISGNVMMYPYPILRSAQNDRSGKSALTMRHSVKADLFPCHFGESDSAYCWLTRRNPPEGSSSCLSRYRNVMMYPYPILRFAQNDSNGQSALTLLAGGFPLSCHFGESDSVFCCLTRRNPPEIKFSNSSISGNVMMYPWADSSLRSK